MAFSQHQARDTLSLYQAVGMAFGGKPKDAEKYVKTLRKVSGHFDREPEPITDEKTGQKTSIFSGISGIPSMAEYQETLRLMTTTPKTVD